MTLTKKQVQAIKAKAKRNYNYKPLFFKVDGQDQMVYPKKYAESWWKKATAKDILRVSVR